MRTKPLLPVRPRGITLLLNGFENLRDNVEGAAVDSNLVAVVRMVAIVGFTAAPQDFFGSSDERSHAAQSAAAS
jgi:hypothetical protein